MLRNDSELFRAAVEDVTRQLVGADHRNGFSFVRTPLRYPGGASVVVRVAADGEMFLVSDHGVGYEEADSMGAAAIYQRHAKAVAEAAGVGFDSHAFFIVRVSRAQLAGAVITVANCSQEAVAIAAYKLAEKRTYDESDELYQRLISVFSSQRVARDAQIVGISHTPWRVTTLVRGERLNAIFEPVSNHPTSIFAAATKFRDIAQTEDAPHRVSVVRSKDALKTWLAILSQTSNVIERDASDGVIQTVAVAA